MIIFRPHKGTLADALAEKREFNTEDEMKECILKDWGDMMSSLTNGDIKEAPFTKDDIVIDDKESDDTRCGWHDTRYVCIKRIGEDVFSHPQCIGMCATNYEKYE